MQLGQKKAEHLEHWNHFVAVAIILLHFVHFSYAMRSDSSRNPGGAPVV